MTRASDLTTGRLRLRHWRDADRAPFAALNADPEVMEHFPARLDRTASDAMVDKIVQREAETGFLFWAVEVVATGEFVGFTGLSVAFQAPFSSPEAPAVEVGWRFARSAWGHGYATEAARGALAYGFGPGGLAEIVSFTVTSNERSKAVMRRLGMHRDPADDFDHPHLPPGHPLRRAVLYRLTRDEWRATAHRL